MFKFTFKTSESNAHVLKSFHHALRKFGLRRSYIFEFQLCLIFREKCQGINGLRYLLFLIEPFSIHIKTYVQKFSAIRSSTSISTDLLFRPFAIKTRDEGILVKRQRLTFNQPNKRIDCLRHKTTCTTDVLVIGIFYICW